jgi:hypothetical protein
MFVLLLQHGEQTGAKVSFSFVLWLMDSVSIHFEIRIACVWTFLYLSHLLLATCMFVVPTPQQEEVAYCLCCSFCIGSQVSCVLLSILWDHLIVDLSCKFDYFCIVLDTVVSVTTARESAAPPEHSVYCRRSRSLLAACDTNFCASTNLMYWFLCSLHIITHQVQYSTI